MVLFLFPILSFSCVDNKNKPDEIIKVVVLENIRIGDSRIVNSDKDGAILSFQITNKLTYHSLKDINLLFVFKGNSGAILNKINKTIFEVVPPSQTVPVDSFYINSPINEQANTVQIKVLNAGMCVTLTDGILKSTIGDGIGIVTDSILVTALSETKSELKQKGYSNDYTIKVYNIYENYSIKSLIIKAVYVDSLTGLPVHAPNGGMFTKYFQYKFHKPVLPKDSLTTEFMAPKDSYNLRLIGVGICSGIIDMTVK